MKHLTARRSRARVVEKLLGLGLVAERKELYKKRRRKSHGPSRGQVRGGWRVPGVLSHPGDTQTWPVPILGTQTLLVPTGCHRCPTGHTSPRQLRRG